MEHFNAAAFLCFLCFLSLSLSPPILSINQLCIYDTLWAEISQQQQTDPSRVKGEWQQEHFQACPTHVLAGTLKMRKSFRGLRLLSAKSWEKELIPYPTASICCERVDLVYTPTLGVVMPPQSRLVRAWHCQAKWVRFPDSSSPWKSTWSTDSSEL